jgi:hypothetical protein
LTATSKQRNDGRDGRPERRQKYNYENEIEKGHGGTPYESTVDSINPKQDTSSMLRTAIIMQRSANAAPS